MFRLLASFTFVLAVVVGPVQAGDITGHYLESRTCDVWTGPCFANAEMNLGGKQALLAWKVDKGTLDQVRLDGLSVVAVIAASDTLGQKQNGIVRSVLIVDSKADTAQRAALIQLAKNQGGELVRNVVGVESAAVDFTMCECDGQGCARLKAGSAKLETRCLDDKHDRVCGNEAAFYPPLAKNVKAKPVIAVEHGYNGKAFNETWKETDRRGAYVGSFEIR